MPRYWVIAPVESKNAKLFDEVWQFDLDYDMISIGWSEVGDVSAMGREELSDAVAATYPEKPPATQALIANMLWAFYHEIGVGDLVIARRGQKTLAAVGEVVHPGDYAPGFNPSLAPPGYTHPNFLDVKWRKHPRDKVFPKIVFPRQTLAEISEDRYRKLLKLRVAPRKPRPTKVRKTRWSDIRNLRQANATWRIGSAARWVAKVLGLPSETVEFVRPNGQRARGDKKLGSLREEWQEQQAGS